MIEVTFIEDKVYQLNEKGKPTRTPEKDRIQMRVRNISGGEVVNIEQEQSKDVDLTRFIKVS